MGRFKARRSGRQTQAPAPGAPDGVRPARPPEIFLRKCTWAEAMLRLDQQVRAHARQGRREILVVHGKGLGSPDGRGVLGSAVCDWCSQHPDLVIEWRPAPPAWGGDGAKILTLRT
ncbi:MAG TPA: Smr/MutS family protein [Candidatus Krumholzibacteria bacterium]|nr:Smr/MutS family protein [Candidatus Krumholzibacteria bacterium]HPD70535.1 Smr/MutS family protein [Candidatus Krumholzibacteria bacterium]HRY39765.1 Smr/MutS family protein [Candidatus Krumholzibacteria bacterium]